MQANGATSTSAAYVEANVGCRVPDMPSIIQTTAPTADKPDAEFPRSPKERWGGEYRLAGPPHAGKGQQP